MDVEVDAVELFEEGAKVLTQEMVKGGWTVVRGWLARVFEGDEAKRGRALAELEESREELSEDPTLVSEVEEAWKVRLRRLLREDAGAAEELRALLDEVAPRESGGTTVINTARDVRGNAILIQAGSIGRVVGPERGSSSST
ncbi:MULTISPECIES: hypothetical protein [Nocardiopsis]|uniref:Uncharacterized protein n=2 Tax=Nocardiopsis alba TaxID=53437 RepID=A0A7K2IZ64_9ACTN|nr:MULTISPECIES: hypothetical protein [Nocardiopsis]AFR08121.1 hypothetical protein B005_4672 [Nocardiopsis alba ATCC BAA-2165]MEC3891384.1 hypothetical protein [Nocardiopsis sp. LDBS1602]MYR35270.1 hypothetical protein [Nocardiopsis alba]